MDPVRLPESLRPERVRHVSEMHVGETWTTNFSALACTGDYECFLDPAEKPTEAGLHMIFIRRDQVGYHVVVPRSSAHLRVRQFSRPGMQRGWIPVISIEIEAALVEAPVAHYHLGDAGRHMKGQVLKHYVRKLRSVLRRWRRC